MEILETVEDIDTVDGKPVYRCTRGVLRADNVLYSAHWDTHAHPPDADVDPDWLCDVRTLDTCDRGPVLDPAWSVFVKEAPEARGAGVGVGFGGFSGGLGIGGCWFVQTPPLLAYANTDSRLLETRIRRDVEACELLRAHPHPNLPVYLGCVDVNSRVAGLCFPAYRETLLDQVNPKRRLDKQSFTASERPLVDRFLLEKLDGLLAAIRHLHALGLVHNDIQPENIVVDHARQLVLVHFGSCRRLGEPLGATGVARTPGWHDPAVETAKVENDLEAFAELRTWLCGRVEELWF